MSEGQLICNPSLVLSLLVDECRGHGVDVLLAVQPVISDGRLAPVLAQDWEHSVVMWATPEQQTGEMISGNSLVKGPYVVLNLYRQLT